MHKAASSKNHRQSKVGRVDALHPLLLEPTPERYHRGTIERLVKSIADSYGHPSQPWHSVDTLLAMERRGTISREMRAAGEAFRLNFRRAQLDPLHAADMARTPGTASRLELTSSAISARDRVWLAILKVGGLRSPGGSCLWHVVGWERSLKEWALGEAWNSRRITPESASGILIAALGVLAGDGDSTTS